MVLCSCLVFLLLCAQVFCDSNSSNNNLFNSAVAHEWLIPQLGSKNSLCNNHSKFYWKELQSLKLWATEMFDAAGKFPSGILYGSPYALGNFDECLDIKVPYQNEHFVGQYCIAKITISPNNKYKMKDKVDYEFGDYEEFYNISAWSKMSAYTNEASKASRNDIYFSFCVPSSCTHDDLKGHLTYLTDKLNHEFSDFVLKIVVDKNHCQTKKKYYASLGDAIFISVIASCSLIVLGCSIYDMCSRTQDSFLPKAPGKCHDLLLCFSLLKNLKKLSTKTRNDDGLDCLAGVKVISMFLIIFGHRCMFTFGAPILNPIFLERMYSRLEAAAILNGPIIVDTFFLVSGFLASYFILSALKYSNSLAKVVLIYVHRLIRMTPTYAVVVAFYCTVYISIGSGPFWQERIGVETQRCRESWWTNILFMNNYVNTDKLCMFQSWYITCDMHYFFLVPVLALLLKWKAVLGVITISSLIVCSILIVVTSVYINNEEPILLLYVKLLRDPISSTTFRNIYIPSHMRASPYFVGVLTGYIKYKMKHSPYKLPKWLTRTGWFLAAVISLATIHIGFLFYLPQFTDNTITSAVYAGFHHFTFALCVAWLIIAVSSGKGPWIEPILCWNPFILLSRISYTAFLCHGAVQLYTIAVLRQPNYTSLFATFYAAFGDIVTAYGFGFLLSMFFESPVIGIERIIFSKSKRKQQPATHEDRITNLVRVSQVLDSPARTSATNSHQTEQSPRDHEDKITTTVHVSQFQDSPTTISVTNNNKTVQPAINLNEEETVVLRIPKI